MFFMNKKCENELQTSFSFCAKEKARLHTEMKFDASIYICLATRRELLRIVHQANPFFCIRFEALTKPERETRYLLLNDAFNYNTLSFFQILLCVCSFSQRFFFFHSKNLALSKLIIFFINFKFTQIFILI